MSTVFVEPAYHTELIDGHEVEKLLPKKLHARVQAFLLRMLGIKLPGPYEALPELNVLCGEDRLVPDITVTERTARYEDGDLADPPLLAVEIMSPGQSLSNMLNKCERLHKAGTPECWVIWPEKRQAWTYAPGSFHEASKTLTVSLDPIAVEISLAEMWSELD
jgi:Uma2 family endonuclease